MTTVKIYTDSDDTRGEVTGASWALCRADTSATIDSSSTVEEVGCFVGPYRAYRYILWFDTSSVLGSINSAKLGLYCSADFGSGTTAIILDPGSPSKPAIGTDFDITNFSSPASSPTLLDDQDAYVEITITDTTIINAGGTTVMAVLDSTYDWADSTPPGNNYVQFRTGDHITPTFHPYLEIDYDPPDTAILKDFALKAFAYRTMHDSNMYENPNGTKISHVRFFDSNGDYIETKFCRNFASTAPLTTNIFDDTGGSEADPEYTSVTQYYKDLTLTAFVPRFTKVYDTDAYSYSYNSGSFSVVDYKIYNQNNDVIAEAIDSTTNMTIAADTRYRFEFVIRLFNDMVEQTDGENARCIVTEDGLSAIQRRLMHDRSPQDYGRTPTYVGVGGLGSYYIANASDGRWAYDKGGDTYTALGSNDPDTDSKYELFPDSSSDGDAFVFCRDNTPDDVIDGLYFNLATAGTLSTNSTISWQYWDGSDWLELQSVEDGTRGFTVDGLARWDVPADIDVDAEVVAGTTGRYYRAELVGGGWTTLATIPDVAAVTDVQPYVLRTQESETTLQLPYNRKPADIIGAPYSVNICKASAEFGVGGIPEVYDSDGVLLARAFEPTRELALFTTQATVADEKISLGEYTGTTTAAGILAIPDTNPIPLKIVHIEDSNGKIYPSGRIAKYTVNGSNYDTELYWLPVSTQYTITYIGERITPSKTPVNMLSVSSDTQKMMGPADAYIFAADENPSRSDTEADSKYTPNYIKIHGKPMEGLFYLNPNFMMSDLEGINVSSRDLDAMERSRGQWSTRGTPGTQGDWATKQRFEARYTFGFPCVMLEYDFSDYEDMNELWLLASAIGKISGEVGSNQYTVLIWGQGDLNSDDAKDLVTGWKMLGNSTPKDFAVNQPTLSIKTPLDMRWRRDPITDEKVSPYLDNNNRLFLMFLPATEKKYAVKQQVAVSVWNTPHEGHTKYELRRMTDQKALEKYGSTITLLYCGFSVNPVQKNPKEFHPFRKGIDWTYSLGDAYAEWRLKSDDEEEYAVTTLNGETYYPILPSTKLGIFKEKYLFEDTSPSSATGITIYTKYKPLDTLGDIFIKEQNSDEDTSTDSGLITVTEVGWDSTVAWNEKDPAFAHDHDGGAGEGAGYIKFDIKDTAGAADKDWSSGEARRIDVTYLYQKDPTILTTYIVDQGVMFARAHCSPWSYNPDIQPAYGDRIRVYFEVQFEHKRS